MSKYKPTRQGNLAFHSPTRPAVYDPMISDDEKTAVVRKKEITWKARVNDYKLFANVKLKARMLILHTINETWVLELKDKETLFTQVTRDNCWTTSSQSAAACTPFTSSRSKTKFRTATRTAK